MTKTEVQEIALLRETLEVQSVSRDTKRMNDFIIKKAYAYGAKVQLHNGNIYITKGNTTWFPCIVAHTDTVHKIVPDSEYQVVFQNGAYFAWNPVRNVETGVGGDDKVGIYIALAALRDYDNIKVAFFRDEEIGCIGASQALEEFFKDVRYILECDRRGDSDFVDNIAGPLQSKAFRKAVAPLLIKNGYKFSSGMMTDVDSLKDIVPVCMANMSCGYYNPHSAKEFVEVFDVERARTLVYDIFNTLDTKRWDHVMRGKTGRSVVYYGGYYGWDENDWGGGSYGSGNSTRSSRPWQSNGYESVDSYVEKAKQSRLKGSNRIIRIIEEKATVADTLALPATTGRETDDIDVWHRNMQDEMDDDGGRVLFDKDSDYFDTEGEGLYEVYGTFDVYITMSPELIRNQAELPKHIQFRYESDDFAIAQIEIQLGLSDFDCLDDAERWGKNEARSLATRYPIHMKYVRAYRTEASSVTPY